MKKFTLAALSAALLTVTSLHAETVTNDNAGKLVQKLTNNQVDVITTFPSIGNLVGIVIKPKKGNAQETIVYVDKSGQFIVSGAIITADGQNQTENDNKKYITDKIADRALKDISNTSWILDGKKDAKHMVYVVADPNCIYCQKLFVATRPFVDKGDLAIRWIWVGFLKDTSPGLAQAIIADKDPVKAMSINESKFNAKDEKGGLTPLDKPGKEVMDKFNKNMAFLNKYQFPGTPVIIFKDQTGKAQASFGMPMGDQLKNTVNSATTL